MVAFWKIAGGYVLVLALAAIAAVKVFQRDSPSQAVLLQLPGFIHCWTD